MREREREEEIIQKINYNNKDDKEGKRPRKKEIKDVKGRDILGILWGGREKKVTALLWPFTV